MRVGVIQSNYIPWRGYFDFIQSVDLFILHDDVQYTKGDWRNRNKIKIKTWPAGATWLTVPVHYKKTDQLICNTEIDYSTDWQRDHVNRFTAAYSEASNCQDAIDILIRAFAHHDRTISRLNVRLLRSICHYFNIKTPILFSMSYPLENAKTERLIDLLKKTGATHYLSGPAGKDYLDESLFEKNGIKLEYKTYNYPPYPQLWGEFDGAVSILDLIANCGPSKWLLNEIK